MRLFFLLWVIEKVEALLDDNLVELLSILKAREVKSRNVNKFFVNFAKSVAMFGGRMGSIDEQVSKVHDDSSVESLEREAYGSFLQGYLYSLFHLGIYVPLFFVIKWVDYIPWLGRWEKLGFVLFAPFCVPLLTIVLYRWLIGSYVLKKRNRSMIGLTVGLIVHFVVMSGFISYVFFYGQKNGLISL